MNIINCNSMLTSVPLVIREVIHNIYSDASIIWDHSFVLKDSSGTDKFALDIFAYLPDGRFVYRYTELDPTMSRGELSYDIVNHWTARKNEDDAVGYVKGLEHNGWFPQKVMSMAAWLENKHLEGNYEE